MKDQTRNLSIDLIKIIAMFMVIALHTFKGSWEWRGLASIFYETSVIAIPLFFMASGYCLLGRDNISIRYVFVKIVNIIRLVLTLSVIVWIAKAIVAKDFHVFGFFKLFFGAFLQKGDLWICWYLGAMILIYALLPFLNRLYLHKRYVFNFLLVLFMIEFLVFTGNLDNDGECWEHKVPQIFRIWNWLFYFWLGGVLKTSNFMKNNKKWPAVFVLLFVNILFQEVHKVSINSVFCSYFYSSLIVMSLATLFFRFVEERNITHSPFIKHLSKLFLPIYLFHPIVIRVLDKTAWHSLMPSSFVPFADFITVVAVSVFISYLFTKIPYTDRIMKL